MHRSVVHYLTTCGVLPSFNIAPGVFHWFSEKKVVGREAVYIGNI